MLSTVSAGKSGLRAAACSVETRNGGVLAPGPEELGWFAMATLTFLSFKRKGFEVGWLLDRACIWPPRRR